MAEKKHIITIAGRPGSGKSTTAKKVAAKLGFQHFSSGDLFRALAKEKGIDIVQANLTAEENSELDDLVDGRLREIGAKETKKVIDSRTAWHWIPSSFKVFLDLDLQTAANRILGELTEERTLSENVVNHPEVYAKALKHRLDIETRRYKSVYGIDPYDMSNYDLVINTANNNIDQTVDILVKKFQNWVSL